MKFKIGQKVKINNSDYKFLTYLLKKDISKIGKIVSFPDDFPMRARVKIDDFEWTFNFNRLTNAIINEPELNDV